MNDAFWARFTEIVEIHVRKLITSWGIFNLYDDGKVAFISPDNKKANLYINGSQDVTRDIPIKEGLNLSIGDEVRVLNINFNKKDRIIDHKKVL